MHESFRDYKFFIDNMSPVLSYLAYESCETSRGLLSRRDGTL